MCNSFRGVLPIYLVSLHSARAFNLPGPEARVPFVSTSWCGCGGFVTGILRRAAASGPVPLLAPQVSHEDAHCDVDIA